MFSTISIWGNGKVLELDSGDVCTIMYILNTTLTFKLTYIHTYIQCVYTYIMYICIC